MSFTPDWRMVSPMAEFASSGQKEEGLTQCSNGAAIYRAERRQAERGYGLHWVSILSMADWGLWFS